MRGSTGQTAKGSSLAVQISFALSATAPWGRFSPAPEPSSFADVLLPFCKFAANEGRTLPDGPLGLSPPIAAFLLIFFVVPGCFLTAVFVMVGGNIFEMFLGVLGEYIGPLGGQLVNEEDGSESGFCFKVAPLAAQHV